MKREERKALFCHRIPVNKCRRNDGNRKSPRNNTVVIISGRNLQLVQWSLTFLVSGTGFMENNFSMNGGWEGGVELRH